MAITYTSTLTDTIPTVIEEARFTTIHSAKMSGLTWNITKGVHKGSTVNVPYWGTISASDLTEAVDMAAPQAMADTNVPVTPAEVGCQILLTDKLERDDQEDVKRAAGRLLGEAMEIKRDNDLSAHFASGGLDIGSNGVCTLGFLAAGRAYLAGNSVPAPAPYAVVLHPFTALDIVDVLTPLLPNITNNTAIQAGGSGLVDGVVANYGIGRLFGMPVIEDGNLAAPSNVCDQGIFSTGRGGGIILATADEWDVRPERDESLRATELNIVGEYGTAIYLATSIVELSLDAATPG